MGFSVKDLDEKLRYTNDLFGDAVLTNIKIANKQVMDPFEEEAYLKKLLKTRVKDRRKGILYEDKKRVDSFVNTLIDLKHMDEKENRSDSSNYFKEHIGDIGDQDPSK